MSWRNATSLLSPTEPAPVLRNTFADSAVTLVKPKPLLGRVVSSPTRFTLRKQGSLSLLSRVGAGVF
ncbi:hypothetical protein H9L39_20003 [Fusarium oxysporum f. sp. albedinis]|nr:hypothetical protein H9L39_20003 [Fusarium oxysporum f. sp. albedinis]